MFKKNKMWSARKAKKETFKALFLKEEKCFQNILNIIKEAVVQGEFRCRYQFLDELNIEEQDGIKKALEKKGYFIEEYNLNNDAYLIINWM